MKKEKPQKEGNKIKSKKETNRVAELEDTCKRVQADFENYKKRSQKEKEDFSKFANTDLILQILPILDNFRLATKHLPNELEGNNWAQGVLQIEKQLEQILVAEGVEEIPAIGKFDPYLHEAVAEIDSEKEDGEIIEVISRGYKLNDRVIRHAKVKVAKNINSN